METTEIERTEAATPATMIELAIRQNVDVDKLEKLLALQERWEANQARKAFFEALSEFQSECPVIKKNKKADYPSKAGGRVTYNFATLDYIIAQIKDPLQKHGLSYRWENTMTESSIAVTCIITHRDGHSERATFSAPADVSGNKNDIQSRGSTLTYLQRYTLIGSLGIATAQDDIDGKLPQSKPPGISEVMQERINKCKNLDELSDLWNNEPDLKESKSFNDAVKKRKGELTPKTK